MTNIKQRAHHLLTCDELRGRVPEEVQQFLRDVVALEPDGWHFRAQHMKTFPYYYLGADHDPA